jgi:D-tyrosyl-tRNA(Tyr) deacylase
MRAVIQRVSNASVYIGGLKQASIEKGLLVFLGIAHSDESEDVNWLSSKIAHARIFGDEDSLMNLSVKDVEGEILVISQFTLHASTKKGNRPSFIRAARPEKALSLYEQFLFQLSLDHGKPVKSGIFGEDMQISLLNDGPVTLFIDTRNRE